jgi:hypothetical protein
VGPHVLSRASTRPLRARGSLVGRKEHSKQKYNIVTVKTVNEKDYYTRIGVAFPLEKGGFNTLFDALPTNGRVLLLPERLRSAQ